MDNNYKQTLLMENLEISNKMISDHIKQLERELSLVKKEKVISVQKAKLGRLLDEIESVKGELSIFEIDLCNATEKQRATYFGYFSEYENKITLIEKELKNLQKKDTKNQDTEHNGLMGNTARERNQQKQVFDMERNELIGHVDEKMKEADQDLDIIINDLVQGRDIMEEINVEVKRQQEKLSKTREEIQETYSLTKRSKKLVNYFRRQVMTDKIIWAFLILVIIAIIVIIILRAVGFNRDSFDDNLDQNQTQTVESGIFR